MVKSIKVRPGILAKEHDSFFSAIIEQQKESLNLVNGRAVNAYKYNGDQLVLCLDSGVFILIFAEKDFISWKVIDESPSLGGRDFPRNITFEFPNGDEYLWRWEVEFNQFVGKKIAISPSEQFLFLYSENKREYIFNVLEDCFDAATKYLYISPV